MTSADPEPQSDSTADAAGPASAFRPPDTGTAPAGGPPSPEADLGLLSPMRGAAEATGDVAVLQAMLDAEAALTRAQAALGLVPAEAAQAVSAAARADAFDLPDLVARARSGGNPVIPLVRDLREAAGPHGEHVHRGATSQDIVDTALMLVARRTLGPVLDDLGRVIGGLAALAAGHRDTPMAARTLTQQAVPTTFGLKAAGWLELAAVARTRLAAARAALPAQLGGAAGTLAAFQPAPPRGAEEAPQPVRRGRRSRWRCACPGGSPPSLGWPSRCCPGTSCACPSPTWPGRWPSPPGRWARWRPTCWCCHVPRSGSCPRASAAGRRPCRTSTTRSEPR
ncbi:lyase family protein [Nonomuraea thailandensis]